MGIVRDLAEQLWRGEVSPEARSPFAPLMQIEPVADGVAFVSSFANVTVIEAGGALALVDTGGILVAPMVFGMVRGWSAAPVEAAVYTHGHVDHVIGIDLFDDEARKAGRPRPRVYAHAALPQRFERYKLTAGWNACINARQFRAKVDWPTRFRDPDVLYDRDATFELHGERIELHHARGETDDHTWVWLPSRKVLCTGDLFIWATPNAGNPQKVQRYPREWALALERMAALGAEVLLPGHGVPIFGADRVRQALGDTAALLHHLHDRTVELMNRGAPLDEILGAVEAPAHLLARPYLRPLYDEPEFIVRNVWRQYGGWWDGDPSHLKPARAAHLAAELARLAGGADKLAARAEALAQAGDLPLACHLVELAHQAAPGEAAIREMRRKIYAARAERESSLMAQGVFRTAAEE